MRQLIKRILKEEREKDSSDLIKKLLNNSVVNDYKGMICSIDVVAPWKRGPIGSHSDFKDYQIRVNVIGGIGTKRWPQTQFVYKERDKIVNDVWHTVYNFMGISTDVFLRNVKSCDEVLTESSNERLEKLLGDYITMSYPTAKKFRLKPSNVNAEITSFTLPDPQDERDNLIFKFDVFGKPVYNINPEFLNSIKSMFGEKKNIKKLIQKWFNEKEVDEDLINNPINESLEDIQGMPLYHHTTESRALSIMNTNMLRGTRPDDDILAVDPTLDNTPHQSMVSFTRDKNFVPNETIGASAGGLGDSNKLKVIFVVDKDKLKSNYKIVPFDYSALEDRWYDKRIKDEPDTIMQPKAIRTSKSNEYEERVLTNKIQPLRRYVTDIIYKGDNPLVQEKIDEFLGREKQEDVMSEGLHDTSWENDEGDKVTLIDLLDATEDIPVKNIPVDKIKSKLLTWDDDDKEVAKIEKADLQYPILIFVDDDGKFISIIDGHHRAQKAVRHKLKTIKAKIIPINSLPKNFKKVFGHLGKQEQNESELTERCWKGYTQKGMKTMFGKRYPNCVKVKK